MPCPRCGRRAAQDDRFCGGCGTRLTPTCRHCGRRAAVGTAFCTGCGRSFAPEAEPGPDAVPTEDRRRVSVLFVDLVGFTPYAEQADPELVRDMQTTFYATVRQVVRQYGGVVEKYIGDAVMALFGAPVATEADALRCVRAGLELRRVLAESPLLPDPADRPRFRIGVATGEALVDVAAARDGGQAIVAGDVVNTASRLQSVAPPGGVLVCGHTHALTAESVRYAAQPPVTLRGRSTPSEVWLALAPVQRRAAGTEPDDTPLVEREHELSLLVNALHRTVRDRTPQLVTIFGQAGIGKSRLARELYRRARPLIEDVGEDAGLTWHTGYCPPFGENVTYAGLADIVKAHAGVRDTDGPDTTYDRLSRSVRALVDPLDADRLVAALGPLVGLPGDDLPAKEAESAWRRFLVALAARSPTVLVFEDLHWADEPMLRFIELLAASARDVPLLVLTTSRPQLVDRDTSWAGVITGSLTITLTPLRSSGIATLYGHMLGRAAFGADRLRPLIELAGGNPLYAQEYVRMLIERRALEGRGEMPDGVGLPMPDSVHAVIANRVDLLDPGDRAALQAAAVVGMQFWPGAVAAAVGRPVEAVERSLRRLEQREFISEQAESTMAGEGEFRFRHVLVRDVCYQRLPRTERVARHERTARWLEERSTGRDTDLAEVLAHHRWAAHEIARTLGDGPARRHAPAARAALHLAARRACALHAFDAAAGHIGRALSLSGPADPEPERLRMELLATEIAFYRDQAGFLAGDGTGQLRTLADRLTELADPAEAARAWTLLGQASWLRMDRTAALTYLGRAVALFQDLPDSGGKVDAYAELGRLHMLNYEQEPAIAAAKMAAEIAERLGLLEARTNARITMATARHAGGDATGVDELRALTELCRERRLLALPRATQNLAAVLLDEGEWRESVALVREGVRAGPQGRHALLTGFSLAAVEAFFAGDFDAFTSAADAFADAAGGQWDMHYLRGLRSCLRVLRDQPIDPTDDLTDAVAGARRSGFHRPLWTALATTGLCRALQGRRAEAADFIVELSEDWRKVRVIASGEWVCPAAYAAALAGRRPSEALRVALTDLDRRTRWADAALRTVTGAVAFAAGDGAAAARHHLAAAGIYGGIKAAPYQVLGLALPTAALRPAGAEAAAGPLSEVRAFAARNRAPALLRIAHHGRGCPASADELRR